MYPFNEWKITVRLAFRNAFVIRAITISVHFINNKLMLIGSREVRIKQIVILPVTPKRFRRFACLYFGNVGYNEQLVRELKAFNSVKSRHSTNGKYSGIEEVGRYRINESLRNQEPEKYTQKQKQMIANTR